MAAVEFSPRAEWTDLPANVRAGIEHLLGASVVDAVNQHGGFSPGLAARVECADGSRAFVKAVGPELNADSPDIHRNEIHRARQLPAHFPVPRFRDAYDDGSWVALVLDEIDGALPATPWKDGELERVIDAVAELAELGTPSPLKDVPTAAEKLSGELGSYSQLAENPPDDLDPWEAKHLDRLATLGNASLAHLGGKSVVHLDIRADNVLMGRDGRVYFIDWPWACNGAPWIDTVVLLINAAYNGYDPERLARRSRVLRGVDPMHISGLLAGLTGYFSKHSRRPAPPGLPTLREFQRAQMDVTLHWLERRLRW